MRLHEILALEKGVKVDAHQVLSAAIQTANKPTLLAGLARTYRPMNEGEPTLPPEITRLQLRASKVIADVQNSQAQLLDLVAVHEMANQTAKADVVIPGVGVVMTQVPVTYLLFLEKSIGDLREFIARLPVLDPTEDWVWDPNTGSYRTGVVSTVRREKRKVVLVKYEATDKHPAQTEVYDNDVPVGYWDQVRESGALPQEKVTAMWERAGQLLAAVRVARQQANSIEVARRRGGAAQLLDYLFNGAAPVEAEDSPA